MYQTEKLYQLAQKIADQTPGFFEKKGPGIGDKSTYAYMKELIKQADQAFGNDCSEKKICGETKFAVDFFFPDESTIVEVALSLRNSNSEFQKDILKAILSQKADYSIKKLIFIAKPGAIKRHNEPASRSIIDFVAKEYGISIIIKELNHS